MRTFLGAVAALAAAVILPAAAQSPFTLEGADRAARIEQGARKEGALTLYTTIAEKDLPGIVGPFEKKYGIKVNVWRAGTDKVLQRTVTEHQARKHDVDVVHFGAPEMEALTREKILAPVSSPLHKDLQEGSVPAHKSWAATILSVWVQAYNTGLFKKEDLPKTYKDLANPKYKGKLGIEAKNDDWFATVVHLMGGEQQGIKFFQDVVATNGISPRQGHTLLNNMVVSGEVPLALTVYNYMPEQAKKKGAPIDWFALEPAVARANAVGVTRNAPHPHAAMLFYDYLLGPEGQQAMAALDYVPTNTRVESPLKGVKIVQTDPVRSLDEQDKWKRLFEETVLRKAGK